MQAPDGVSDQETRRINREVAAILSQEPAIQAAAVFSVSPVRRNPA